MKNIKEIGHILNPTSTHFKFLTILSFLPDSYDNEKEGELLTQVEELGKNFRLTQCYLDFVEGKFLCDSKPPTHKYIVDEWIAQID